MFTSRIIGLTKKWAGARRCGMGSGLRVHSSPVCGAPRHPVLRLRFATLRMNGSQGPGFLPRIKSGVTCLRRACPWLDQGNDGRLRAGPAAQYAAHVLEESGLPARKRPGWPLSQETPADTTVSQRPEIRGEGSGGVGSGTPVSPEKPTPAFGHPSREGMGRSRSLLP